MNRFLKIFCVVMCCLLVLSLGACNKSENNLNDDSEGSDEVKEQEFVPDSAISLWNKIDETMNALDSYKSVAVGTAVIYYEGQKVDTTIDMLGIFSTVDGQKYSYEAISTTLSCDEMDINEKSEELKAYYNGKMYIATKDPSGEQKLCSTLTYDEFKDSEEASAMDKLDITDCNKSEFHKNDDGSWSLSFSGYTKKAMDSFLEDSDFSSLGVEVDDIKISVTADSNYRAMKVSLTLEFDTPKDPITIPSLEMSCEYSEYNNTLPNYEDIKVDEYTEVHDVRLLSKVNKAIGEHKDSALGGFDLSINQKSKLGNEENKMYEKDTVTYGEKNGKFYYTVVSESQDGKLTLKHENGVCEYSDSTGTESYAETEDEAKGVISGLIDISGFESSGVTGISKIGEGVYKFNINTSSTISKIKEVFKSVSATVSKAIQDTTVTMNGDAVTKIETKIVVTGTYKQGGSKQTLEITYDVGISFN